MGEPHYYYAGGERVLIDLDEDRVCVDLAAARGGPPLLRQWLDRSRPQVFKGELALIERRELPQKVLEALEARSAIQPVFRHADALLVALPEVRVEATRAQTRRLGTLLEKGPIPASVEEQGEHRTVLRPLSGKGGDALALANSLHEALQPQLAQARFVRIVPKPGPRRAGKRGR